LTSGTDDTFDKVASAEAAEAARQGGSPLEDLGEKLFALRDYTPIPLILIVLIFAHPTIWSATLGTLIAIFGELLRVYAVAFIGSVSRTRNTTTTGGALITNGPFAWTRNPLYVANFLITFGMAIFSGRMSLMILTALAFAAQYVCIVAYEEKLLVERFGETYEDYRRTVPAWVPSRLPSLATVEWPDTFSPALKSERRTLAAIAVMLVLLVLRGGSGA
jgi:protein-S-isoprenylcysteine O-methyltransferase Ste14